MTLLHDFIANNRGVLIERCKGKVAERFKRSATEAQLRHGIAMFIDQLTRTLRAEQSSEPGKGAEISGAAGGDTAALSEMGVVAAAHGEDLLNLGYSVDQVVHDYGDLCQAITDLAFERDAPFSVDEFRTLNRCLDNAIADAVTAFSSRRDTVVRNSYSEASNEQMRALLHEVRNYLATAALAIRALEVGSLTMGTATGAVLKRSISSLCVSVDQSLAEIRGDIGVPSHPQTYSVASCIEEAKASAELTAAAEGCPLIVANVDPLLGVRANRERLLHTLKILLDNAFEFSRAGTTVHLDAFSAGSLVFFEVKDGCGGLSPGYADQIFLPFSQMTGGGSSLGLELSSARQSVEADGGTLSVRDMPGVGCVFRISFPRESLH